MPSLPTDQLLSLFAADPTTRPSLIGYRDDRRRWMMFAGKDGFESRWIPAPDDVVEERIIGRLTKWLDERRPDWRLALSCHDGLYAIIWPDGSLEAFDTLVAAMLALVERVIEDERKDTQCG